MSDFSPASIRELTARPRRQRGQLCPLNELSEPQWQRYRVWHARHAPLVRAAEYSRLPLAMIERATFTKWLIEQGRLHR